MAPLRLCWQAAPPSSMPGISLPLETELFAAPARPAALAPASAPPSANFVAISTAALPSRRATWHRRTARRSQAPRRRPGPRRTMSLSRAAPNGRSAAGATRTGRTRHLQNVNITSSGAGRSRPARAPIRDRQNLVVAPPWQALPAARRRNDAGAPPRHRCSRNPEHQLWPIPSPRKSGTGCRCSDDFFRPPVRQRRLAHLAGQSPSGYPGGEKRRLSTPYAGTTNGRRLLAGRSRHLRPGPADTIAPPRVEQAAAAGRAVSSPGPRSAHLRRSPPRRRPRKAHRDCRRSHLRRPARPERVGRAGSGLPRCSTAAAPPVRFDPRIPGVLDQAARCRAVSSAASVQRNRREPGIAAVGRITGVLTASAVSSGRRNPTVESSRCCLLVSLAMVFRFRSDARRRRHLYVVARPRHRCFQRLPSEQSQALASASPSSPSVGILLVDALVQPPRSPPVGRWSLSGHRRKELYRWAFPPWPLRTLVIRRLYAIGSSLPPTASAPDGSLPSTCRARLPGSPMPSLASYRRCCRNAPGVGEDHRQATPS